MNALCVIVPVSLLLCAHVSASAGTAPLLTLNDGRSVPGLGLGTWLGLSNKAKSSADEVQKAVESAIDIGYRHIDTASIYDTETQVGKAVNKKIADGVVKREELFITTKLWNDRHARDAVVPALQESLTKLGLDYVDLYLVHWPISQFPNGSVDNTDYLETWQGMIEAREQGLAKSIGVSNFNQEMLDRVVTLSPVAPAMLQVELNLNLQQPDLLGYCRSKNITVTAYTPFGSLFPSKALPDAPPPRVDEPELVAMAARYNKTVTQLALRYLVELGVVPIPKSVHRERIAQNIAVFDFALRSEDREALRRYDTGYRTIAPKFWINSPYYPFEKN